GEGVEGSCERWRLTSESVTNKPAVNPPIGTSHDASRKRKREGLVQIVLWSSAKSRRNERTRFGDFSGAWIALGRALPFAAVVASPFIAFGSGETTSAFFWAKTAVAVEPHNARAASTARVGGKRVTDGRTQPSRRWKKPTAPLAWSLPSCGRRSSGSSPARQWCLRVSAWRSADLPTTSRCCYFLRQARSRPHESQRRLFCRRPGSILRPGLNTIWRCGPDGN